MVLVLMVWKLVMIGLEVVELVVVVSVGRMLLVLNSLSCMFLVLRQLMRKLFVVILFFDLEFMKKFLMLVNGDVVLLVGFGIGLIVMLMLVFVVVLMFYGLVSQKVVVLLRNCCLVILLLMLVFSVFVVFWVFSQLVKVKLFLLFSWRLVGLQLLDLFVLKIGVLKVVWKGYRWYGLFLVFCLMMNVFFDIMLLKFVGVFGMRLVLCSMVMFLIVYGSMQMVFLQVVVCSVIGRQFLELLLSLIGVMMLLVLSLFSQLCVFMMMLGFLLVGICWMKLFFMLLIDLFVSLILMLVFFLQVFVVFCRVFMCLVLIQMMSFLLFWELEVLLLLFFVVQLVSVRVEMMVIVFVVMMFFLFIFIGVCFFQCCWFVCIVSVYSM